MEIMVEITSVFGVERVYPRCEKSELFAKIAGTKSLTEETINYIKALGYKIVVYQEKAEL